MTAHGVYGVDFSGAADAGKRIWLAEAVARDGFVSIRACFPGRDLPGSGVARGLALPALRAFIAARGGATFGIDVPFGLPAQLVDESDWTRFVSGFPARYPKAEAFRADCLARANGRELKRKTDRDARTPFSAYNLRLYKQTFHGLNDVIGPLVAEGAAVAVPMQAPTHDRAVLAEVCPASTLIRHGVREPYKQRAAAPARARLVDWLVRTTPMAIPARIRSLAVEEPNGDAVDSLIAAGAAARALRLTPPPSSAERLEGHVYL